jgi:hypothetical protein
VSSGLGEEETAQAIELALSVDLVYLREAHLKISIGDVRGLTRVAAGGMQGVCGTQGGGLTAEARKRRERVRLEATGRFE